MEGTSFDPPSAGNIIELSAKALGYIQSRPSFHFWGSSTFKAVCSVPRDHLTTDFGGQDTIWRDGVLPYKVTANPIEFWTATFLYMSSLSRPVAKCRMCRMGYGPFKQCRVVTVDVQKQYGLRDTCLNCAACFSEHDCDHNTESLMADMA